MPKKDIPNGSIRIKIKGFKALKKTSDGYVDCKDFDVSNIRKVVKLYNLHNNIEILRDSNDKSFFKGYVNSDGKISGERVILLPNGKRLNKAFSLFAPHLTIHETIHEHGNNHHWDVIYQNPNGKYAYLYTVDKINSSQKEKYKKVEEFDEVLPKLNRNLITALKKKEIMALSLYTLVKTYMRIGSEIYFKKNRHKGLTTLQKDNVVINGNRVIFNFLGKDGVPHKIDLVFPEIYIKNLEKRLKKLNNDNYVFCDNNENKLLERDFHNAFKKYGKKEFYPHIVRSHYATKTIENFLKKNPKPSKNDVRQVYNEIAEKLGHKKFSKKKNAWEPSHTVTVAHYVSPKLVNKLNKIVNSSKKK